MISPYAILEVDESAADEEVKKAYLVKVREHPPERDPRGFQKIRSAFETIRTEKDRLRYRLFYYGQPDLDLLNEKWLVAGQDTRPSERQLTDLLAVAVKACRIDKG